MRVGGIALAIGLQIGLPVGLPVGLALAALSAANAGAAENWTKAQPVSVIASEYQFSPNKLSFRRGVAYRLHIENRGRELHEFTAPAFFKSVEARSTAVLNAGKTEIEIPPGTAKDFYFVPLRAGHFGLRCADHDWAGMVGEITVR